MSPSSVFPDFPHRKVHTIPHHHQSGNLRDPKVEAKRRDKRGGGRGWGDGGVRASKRNTKICTRTPWWSHPATGTHQRDVPRPLYSGIPHRKVTPSLTIIRVESSGMIILMLKKSIKRRMRSME
ncbi:unnamed protein product [Staurois parvus]|uniref:Uncharacterized protein n=1 Tax=Staurois parvus TaxID=386267 RepID=A0ABN9BR97_9NEOB|nr:unnamed protein product [Staurois parvus]